LVTVVGDGRVFLGSLRSYSFLPDFVDAMIGLWAPAGRRSARREARTAAAGPVVVWKPIQVDQRGPLGRGKRKLSYPPGFGWFPRLRLGRGSTVPDPSMKERSRGGPSPMTPFFPFRSNPAGQGTRAARKCQGRAPCTRRAGFQSGLDLS